MKVFVVAGLIVLLLAPCRAPIAIAAFDSARSTSHVAPLQSSGKWRSIRTNNLFVVGNAEEEDLRQVAVWLEFFHTTFAQLISRSVLDASVPTTVIVFRDDASFVPFKPIYQGKPVDLAGYFQAGLDMNYIALSLERGSGSTLKTAFHEYVHLHLRDSVPNAPLWLSEGLAEMYGSIVHANNEAVLGAPIPFYVRLLGRQEMIPLKTLLSIGFDSPHYNEEDKTGIFYAQSWALVHYLMMGEGGRRHAQFKTFLNRVSGGDEASKAIEPVFGMSLDTLEKEFREYVRRAEFPSQRIAVGTGPAPFIAMQRTAISDGEANFYLGDLLLHIRREADAETYFKRALALDPGFTPTYASLGYLCVRQGRYAEAKKYLARAVGSPQSYLIHYLYAYVISREGLGANREGSKYSPEEVKIMRDELRKAIRLAPEFADAHYLLALVNLVEGDQLDEAVTLARRAQKLSPSKLAYSLLLAQIYMSQRNPELAREVLEPLARQTANPSVRADAQELLDSLDSTSPSPSTNRADRVGASVMLELNEPTVPGSTSVKGGSISEVAIRDGNTIESSGPMPSVEMVMDRFIQAAGGIEALSAPTSRVARGSLDVVGVSRGGSIEFYAKGPNKILTIMQAYPFGVVKLGFNGTTAWADTPDGQRLVKGDELIGVLRDSVFFNPVWLKANYRIKLLGKSKIGYREVYVLELQPATGAAEKLYLDQTTYLPVRANRVSSGGQQPGPRETYLDDWREINGIKSPFSMTQTRPGMSISIVIKEIRYNVPVDDSLFEAPAGVRQPSKARTRGEARP